MSISPALDIGHQALQGRALGVAAREAGIVVVVGDRDPPLAPLAGDEGVARFLLRVDGVELLVEPLVRGHPAVDRTAFARLGGGNSRHQAPPLRPKNSGPLQCCPVMCLATAVRLLKLRPSYSKRPSAVTVTRCSRSPHSRSSTVPGAKLKTRGLARSLILECFAPMASRRWRVSGAKPPKTSSCIL